MVHRCVKTFKSTFRVQYLFFDNTVADVTFKPWKLKKKHHAEKQFWLLSVIKLKHNAEQTGHKLFLILGLKKENTPSLLPFLEEHGNWATLTPTLAVADFVQILIPRQDMFTFRWSMGTPRPSSEGKSPKCTRRPYANVSFVFLLTNIFAYEAGGWTCQRRGAPAVSLTCTSCVTVLPTFLLQLLEPVMHHLPAGSLETHTCTHAGGYTPGWIKIRTSPLRSFSFKGFGVQQLYR